MNPATATPAEALRLAAKSHRDRAEAHRRASTQALRLADECLELGDDLESDAARYERAAENAQPAPTDRDLAQLGAADPAILSVVRLRTALELAAAGADVEAILHRLITGADL